MGFGKMCACSTWFLASKRGSAFSTCVVLPRTLDTPAISLLSFIIFFISCFIIFYLFLFPFIFFFLSGTSVLLDRIGAAIFSKSVLSLLSLAIFRRR